MKKTVLLVFVIAFSFLIKAQTNLVPNPSFEIYSSCPTTSDQLNYALGWLSFGESPDYFNSCSTIGLGVPSNVVGYQNANSGAAYAGFVAYSNMGFAREFLGSQLTQTLTIGIKYYLSIKVSLAEFDAINQQYIPCDKIGLRLSSVPFSSVTPAPSNNFAHLYINSIITDTMNWVTIKGSFIADSSYQYIMIGNFFDDANTSTIFRPNGAYSYFFIDDICLSTDSTLCSFTTNIDEKNIHNIKVFPNPVTHFIYFENIKEESEILIIDLERQILLNQKTVSNVQIDVSNFLNGFYFIEIKSKSNQIKSKIIINH
jgi:hypothetical protein